MHRLDYIRLNHIERDSSHVSVSDPPNEEWAQSSTQGARPVNNSCHRRLCIEAVPQRGVGTLRWESEGDGV